MGTSLVLVALGAVVIAVRGVGFEQVLSPDLDGALLAIDDAQYHARRAAYTYQHFPAVLAFDPYLNYPRGAWVPWPPLYDFGLGAAGWLIGALEPVLVWSPVLLGLATAFVVYAIGNMLAGPGLAIPALAIFALLPASSRYTSVGNPDHHAAVALIASLWLACLVASLGAGGRRARTWGLQAILVLVRSAMLLTWHGSLLYIVLAETLALGVAAAFGRREQLLAQSVGCSLAALVGWAALWLPHSELGGPWSPVELSRLQPATLAAFACVALVPAGWRGGAIGPRLLVTAVSLACAAGGVALLAWESLASGWAYLARAEPFIAHNFETQPLWTSDNAVALFSYAAWGLLLTPIAGLWLARRAERPEPALVLAGWTAGLLVLASSSARYASDLAPAASVSIALLLFLSGEALTERGRLGRVPVRVATALLVLLLMLPAMRSSWRYAARSALTLAGYEVEVERPGLGLTRSVYAFVDAVRQATPDTGDTPAYGILTPNTLGFVMNARGQRPTPAGNFGPYAGREGLELTRAFYRAKDEREVFHELRAQDIRYVVTSDGGSRAPASMLHRLHRDDGSRVKGRPALGHFRLVTEAPSRGVPLGALGGAAPDFVDEPYKLFEVVEGAVLQVRGSPPGRPVHAQLEVTTPSGRRFAYRASATASSQGVARLRVPYADEAWLVETDSGRYRVRVEEHQVASGLPVEVPGAQRNTR